MVDFPPTIMSMALIPNKEPKVFCDAVKWGRKWKIAECRFEMGHDGGHVDCQQGIKWD